MIDLPSKYRPSRLDQIIGQPAVVRALRALHDIPHAILFTGPSGVGKTTLARIIAADLKADVVPVDAASCSGVDSMRELLRFARYRPLGKERRAIILDEVQALSLAAFQVLLAPLEEPATWLYWLLATTEPTKLPPTIRTRCRAYHLRSVTRPDLLAYVQQIAERERIDADPAVLALCVQEARGSVRQALVNLEVVRECARDRRTVRALLYQPTPKAERANGTDALASMVAKGFTRDQMAEALGVDRTTIWRRLNKAINAGAFARSDIKRG